MIVPFSFALTLFLSILLAGATLLNSPLKIPPAIQTAVGNLSLPFVVIRQKKAELIRFVLATPSIYKENQKLKNENNYLKTKIKNMNELIADQGLIDSLTASWQIQPIRLVAIDRHLTFISHNYANIKPGQPVASGNSLVGLVSEVKPPVIKVEPLSQLETKIGVQLETGAKGSYLFRNSEPRVVDLQSGVTFNPQTIVLTAGSELIPPDLVIGKIDKITTTASNPTQEAIIALDEKLDSGNFFVITGVN